MRKALIKIYDIAAGVLTEDEHGYHFVYADEYLRSEHPAPVSKTLPLKKDEYHTNVLFPFFDGLIPEGWLLEVAEHNWKLDPRDRMGLLLACCRDCIGAVSVQRIEGDDE
ncbi:MAG: HipA N-terminal domain-containing protein [Acidobacteriota bacterium]